MNNSKLITRAELPNVKKLMEQFAPSRPILLGTQASISSGTETVLNSVDIPAFTINEKDTFTVDLKGFFIGNPLTSGSLRVRMVNDGNNFIWHTFTYAPGAAATLEFYLRGHFMRQGASFEYGFVTIPTGGAGVNQVVSRAESSINFNVVCQLQLNAFATGTTQAAVIESSIVMKNRMTNL